MSTIDNIIDQLAATTVDDVREVSFAGKGMKLDTEEDAAEVVEAIQNCSGMTSLCLEGNTIGVLAAKAIAKALESQSCFRNALWKDMFTQRTEHEIPDALNYLSSGIMLAKAHLVELDLSDNAFGYRGLRGIVNLLKSEPCFTLKELRLNNNGLGISGAKMLASALTQCLENSTKSGKRLQLRLFICGRNRLENEGSLALSAFFEEVKSLEYIAMPQNGIYHEGICGLSKAFASNPKLKVLNLEDNTLTEKGVKYIADILPNLTELEIINFGDCLLKTSGATVFAEALKLSCPKLKEVLLGYNEISKEGGLQVLDSIKSKENLEKLVLNGNHFGSSGRKEIIAKVEAINKVDIFGPLDEDESDDDDDDNDEEEEEEEDDINESAENISESQQNGSYVENSVINLSDFMEDPTDEKLQQLFESKISILSELQPDPTFKDYCDLFLKLSSMVKNDPNENLDIPNHYADEILCSGFKLCNEDEMWKFNNDFLVVLGLIKDEDKVIKNDNVTGSLILLKHAVKGGYFPNSTRELLKFILRKPLRVKVSPVVVSSLLQTLYQL